MLRVRADAWWKGGRGATSLARKPLNARCPRQSERADGRFQSVIIHFFGKRRRLMLMQSKLFKNLQRFASSVSLFDVLQPVLCISLPNCRRKRTTAGRSPQVTKEEGANPAEASAMQ
jgi:hypothetical protein